MNSVNISIDDNYRDTNRMHAMIGGNDREILRMKIPNAGSSFNNLAGENVHETIAMRNLRKNHERKQQMQSERALSARSLSQRNISKLRVQEADNQD